MPVRDDNIGINESIQSNKPDSKRNVQKDKIAPEVTINLPKNNSYHKIAPQINVAAFDGNMGEIWYQVYSTATGLSGNFSLPNGGNQQLNGDEWSNLDEGIFELRIFANDTLGNVNNSFVYTLYKDTIVRE